MKKLYKNILDSIELEHKDNVVKHKNSRVLIVDGLNTFIRCWSAVPTMNEDGDHVAGVTGVLKSIGLAMRNVQATRCIVVFDGKGGSKSRQKVYGGYKSNRDKNKLRVNRQYEDMMNEEDERESMKRQYVWLSELLHNLPITTMMYDGVEADDVMAYIATHLLKEEEQAVLMSTDKDFLLLYRVLDGDVSDHIPGVKGCGIKTLVKRFPELTEDTKITVEEFLQLSEEKRGKIKLYDDIVKSKDQILMNKKLMRLDEQLISGTVKMDILTRFDEPIKPLNKLNFLQSCLKYKVMDKFGNDINSWLKNTFSNIVTD
jgi:5'-3' exonuclease